MRPATLPAYQTSGGCPATGRDTQSMAFFRSGEIEPLYSGEAIRKPSWARNSSFSRAAPDGRPSPASRSPL